MKIEDIDKVKSLQSQIEHCNLQLKLLSDCAFSVSSRTSNRSCYLTLPEGVKEEIQKLAVDGVSTSIAQIKAKLKSLDVEV